MAHRTQRLLRTGLVAVCVSTALLAVVFWPLEELHQRRAELVGDGAYGLATDAAKFKGLEAEISTAQTQNDDLQQGLKSSLGAAEPSSSRVNPNPDWASDYLGAVASHEGVVGQDPGCCGGDDAASQPEPGAAGDVSIGAVIQQMSRKLRAMKQKFREIQASYYHGGPRVIDLKVKPRGPRGFTGDPGEKGPPGDKGAKGVVGPVGPKGRTGYQGETGVQGRKGAKGMTGSIGARLSILVVVQLLWRALAVWGLPEHLSSAAHFLHGVSVQVRRGTRATSVLLATRGIRATLDPLALVALLVRPRACQPRLHAHALSRSCAKPPEQPARVPVFEVHAA